MLSSDKQDVMAEKTDEFELEKETQLEYAASDDQHLQSIELKNRHIVRKLDIHLLPLLVVLFVLSYLDRGNIGNAKTAGMQTDLGLSSTQWSWVLLSFYITYTCLEWMVLCWKIFPAHIYVAGLCFGWGAASMCSGAVSNFAGLITARVFVAVFEAGFGAGVPYFMSLAYKRKELGLRLAIILGMSPIANCIAGALAYGITHIQSPIESWRWLMIIEGLPTVLIAPIVWFFLMDDIKTAKFLTEDERTFAVERLQNRDTTAKNTLSKAQFWAGMGDYKNYCHAIMHFSCNYSFAALSNFLPTIIHNMGYTSITAQGLSAPPYLGAFICSIAAAFLSDRWGQRGWFTAGFATAGCIGYALLASQQGNSIRYAGVWLASCGVFPALALNMTWMLNNQGGETKRGVGMSILAIIGQCSSFVASTVFPNEEAPFYVRGTAIGCGVTGLLVPSALFLHFMLKAENKKRDRIYGPASPTDEINVSVLGDAHQNFRYFT